LLVPVVHIKTYRVKTTSVRTPNLEISRWNMPKKGIRPDCSIEKEIRQIVPSDERYKHVRLLTPVER
jgi:hypothetical protein